MMKARAALPVMTVRLRDRIQSKCSGWGQYRPMMELRSFNICETWLQ